MRGGAVFLAIAAVLLGLATHGLVSGGVYELNRNGPRELILAAEQPTPYAVSLVIYLALGTLFLGLAGLLFWSSRKTRAAEARFFKQRDLLAPKND